MNQKKKNELLNEIKLTNEEIVSNDRYRHFICILYEDSEVYDFGEVMFNVRNFKYYAYIKHLPESNETKEHWHLYLSVDSATTINAIANRLGIPPNYIQYVKSVRASVRYLTHIDYPEKIPYPIENVHVSGAFERKFMKQFEDIKTETEIMEDIYKWINNFHYDNYFEKLKYLP